MQPRNSRPAVHPGRGHLYISKSLRKLGILVFGKFVKDSGPVLYLNLRRIDEAASVWVKRIKDVVASSGIAQEVPITISCSN
jgi:hypothetical protein